MEIESPKKDTRGEGETFAQAIYRARVAEGLSLEELAEKIGFRRFSLFMWEAPAHGLNINGNLPRNYKRRPIKRLAEALDLDEDHLLDLYLEAREEAAGRPYDGRETFARALLKARIRRGLNLQALAALTGFDKATHYGWETGRRLPEIDDSLPRGQRREAIKRLAETLDIEEAHLKRLYEEAKEEKCRAAKK